MDEQVQQPVAGSVAVAPDPVLMRRPHTSPLAVGSLMFGLLGLVLVLPYLTWPWGLVAGVIGLVLGAVAIPATGQLWVTGRTVAVIGLVLSVAAVTLAALYALGVDTPMSGQDALHRMENQIQQWQNDLSNGS